MAALLKVSISLPAELYRRARERGLDLSALTQAAVEAELAGDPNADWIREVSARSPRCERPIDTSALVDVVIDQPTKPWVLEQLEASPVCAPSHQMAEVHSALARLVRALTMQDRVRGLDGLYGVLAQDRGAALVSTDKRLARGQLPVEIRVPG